jgi:hypothetical protein
MKTDQVKFVSVLDAENTDIKQFACSVCHARYPSSRDLKNHFVIKHNDTYRRGNSVIESLSNVESSLFDISKT